MEPDATISVPDAASLAHLPLNLRLFYELLLAAVADKATEVRLHSAAGIDRTTCTVGGHLYDSAQLPRCEVEKELMRLTRSRAKQENALDTVPRKLKPERLAVRLLVRNEMTELGVFIAEEELVITFHNPSTACVEAAAILQAAVNNEKTRAASTAPAT